MNRTRVILTWYLGAALLGCGRQVKDGEPGAGQLDGGTIDGGGVSDGGGEIDGGEPGSPDAGDGGADAGQSPPEAPSGLAASGGHRWARVDWTAPFGASSYDVYRSPYDGGAVAAKVATVFSTTFTDFGVTNGTVYTYFVRANANGIASLNSSSVSFTPAVSNKEYCILTDWDISVLDATHNGAVPPLRSFGSGSALGEIRGIALNSGAGEIVASDNRRSIHTLPRAANGDVSSVRAIQRGTSYDSDISSQDILGVALNLTRDELIVAMRQRLDVFVRTANGYASPVRMIAGSLTGLSSPPALFVDEVNQEIFVAAGSSILVFPANAEGNTAPIRTLSGSATYLSPVSLAVDSVNNELVVLNYASITVYPRTASGNVAYTRAITGQSTNLSSVKSIAVDPGRNEILVTTNAYWPFAPMLVFARTASGNVAPIRTFGALSGYYSGALGVVVDPPNDETVVAANSSIYFYPRNATVDAGPTRVISAQGKWFSGGYGGGGLAVDVDAGELFVSGQTWNDGPAVMVFGRNSVGAANPVRSISGYSTGLGSASDLALNRATNEMVVANSSGKSILVFPANASGDGGAIRTISGAATGIETIGGIALDPVAGEIVVTTYSAVSDSVRFFPMGGTGNISPSRVISGSNTGLRAASGVSVDLINHELFVVNGGDNSLRVYPRNASGDVAPLRVVGNLQSVVRDVFVDTDDNVLWLSGGSYSYSTLVLPRTAGGDAGVLRTISIAATRARRCK